MQIINEVKLDFDDVLIRPKRSNIGSRSMINLERTFKTLNSKKELTCVPIICSNMDTTGTMKMAEELSNYSILTCLHKFYEREDLIEFFSYERKHVFYTLGIVEDDINKLTDISKYVKIDKICVDVANGYTEFFNDKLKDIRDRFPEAIIMAGNVATPEMVQELLLSKSADIIKIGIGPGSVCETRRVSGVGYPQLSAVIESAEAAHGLRGLVCSDGGCRYPGDISKAFGAGADFVMLGGMLAGHDECEGEWEWQWEIKENTVTGKQIRKCLKFYGMSSKEAMDKYNGGMAAYRASEGTCVKIPYKGPVKDTLQQILGGLRSACSYVGAYSLKDLSKCTTFVRT